VTVTDIETNDAAAAAEEVPACWSVLELFGHGRAAGLCREVVRYGETMVQVTVPGDEDNPPVTQFYSPKAIYRETPVSEKVGRAVARRLRPQPVYAYELETPRPRYPLEAHPDPDEGMDAWGGPADDHDDAEETDAGETEAVEGGDR
jgi:hypothetical protein